MLMLVKIDDPKNRKTPRRWELLYLAITLGPWIVMFWLLWPRR
jgi:hypothetical protein